MPTFDLGTVRDEFWRLVRTDGALRTDRITTREDIHARWHWRREKAMRESGRNPAVEDVGRESYMISGKGRPQIQPLEPPLEKRFRYDPMPLAWFDNPSARAVLRDRDPEHGFLELLCAGHLAGYEERPTGAVMYRILTQGHENERERALTGEMLCDIHPEMYPRFRREDALSIWHMARAAHSCDVKRGALSWWLNRFARKPDGWVDAVPEIME